MKKKFVCTLVILALCFNMVSPTFLIKGRASGTAQLPNIDRLIDEESFTGNIADSDNWSLEKVADGSVSFNGGKLVIEGVNNDDRKETTARYYINGADGEGETGIVVFKFDVERSGDGDSYFYINSMSSKSTFNGTWKSGGAIYGYIGSTNTNSGYTTTKATKMSMTVMLNVWEGIYSVWVDGNLVFEDKQMRSTPTDIGYINIYPHPNADQTLSISNFSVYETYPSAEDCLEIDKGMLSVSETVTESFTLPTEGARYKSDITWTVTPEDSEYVNISGSQCIITRPDGENEEVTLTATLSNGGETLSKTFPLTVQRNLNAQERVDLDYENLNISATLGGNTSENEITKKIVFNTSGDYGASISWTSHDTSVIENDGTVIRPKRGDSVNVDVTVTVSLEGATSKSTTFTYTVLPIGLPEIDRLIDEESFIGSIADSDNWSLEKVADGSVSFDSGKLVIEGVNNNDGKETTARYYVNGSESEGENGIIVFEFDVERTGSGNSNFYINSMGNKSAFNGAWNADGKIYGRVGETNTYSGYMTASTKKMSMAVKLNVWEQTYSVWIDGVLVFEDKQMRHADNVENIGYINIYPSPNEDQTLCISNLSVYETYPSPEDCLEIDKGMLSVSETVTESFTLPTEGARYKSDITWTVTPEDSGYVSISGSQCNITRPDVENAQVTLTATLSNGGATLTKTFPLTVLKNLTVQDIVDLDYGNLSISDSLGENTSEDEITKKLVFATSGEYGANITWSSHDTSVISDDGAITRPKRGDGARVDVTVTVSLEGATSKSKTFTYTVLSAGLPKIKRIIAEESFTGDIKNNTKWNLANVVDGSVSFDDGKLKITGVNNNDGKQTTPRYYINGEEAEGEKGLIAFDIDVERNGAGSSNFYINSMSSISAFNGSWNADGRIYGRVGETNTFSGYITQSLTKMSITILLDVEKNSYSVWVDGNLVFEEKQMRGTPLDIGYINIYPAPNADQTLIVSNLTVYEVELSPQEIVERDKYFLSLDNLITDANPIDKYLVDENLCFPNTGKNGSCIMWTSSNEDIITPDGIVNRPIQTENVVVELIAQITYEDSETGKKGQTEKVISVNVLASPPGGDAGIVQADYNWLNETVITSEDKEAVKKDLRFYTEGLYGSKIEWKSKNTDIITERGWVKRPREDENVTVEVIAKISHKEETAPDKEFTFTVLPAKLPIIKEIISEDNFDGDVLDEHWTLTIEDGEIYQEDERLKIVGNPESGNTQAEYYFIDERMYMSGVIASEFYLEKEGSGTALFYATGYDGTYFSGRWEANGDVKLHYRDAEGADSEFHVVKRIHPTDRMHVVMLFDTVFSTWSVWINGEEFVMENVLGRELCTDVESITLYPSPSDNVTLYVDNFKTYYTNPMDEADAINRDFEWLTTSLVTQGKESSYSADFIEDDLYLPSVGMYLSDITWKTSDSSLVSLDGTVTRPGNGATEDPAVTLKATLTLELDDGTKLTKEKEFSFRVLRKLTDPSAIVEAEYNYLDYSVLSDKGSYADMLTENEVVSNIWFMTEGAFGADITWTTDDTSTVTGSGRVIRPMVGENDKTVNVTATISCGNISRTKEFTFVVKADAPFVDPQHMTDEDFFGVWSGADWTISPGLNYSLNEQLKPVEEAAKTANGDYAAAKEALLDYYQAKRTVNESSTLELSSRSSGWSNMAVDGWLTTQSDIWYQGEFSADNNFALISADIKTEQIAKGTFNAFEIAAWYNEASTLEIISNNHSDESLRPRIELIVNGSPKTFYATDDATIRAGSYKTVNYGTEEVNKVMTCGKFLGNETYHTVLKFDFSSLRADDEISDAKMVIYCAATPQSSGKKRMLILQLGETDWDEETITWSGVSRQTFSYNGMPDGHDWSYPEGGLAEARNQALRFPTLPRATIEYSLTGDESYAYKYIRILEDYIKDYGAWYPEGHPEAKGGYKRTLDVAERLMNWISSFDILVKSESMGAESLVAILKAMHDMSNSLYYVHTATGNWWMEEMEAIITCSNVFPEFTNADAWRELSFAECSTFFKNNVFPDGSYIEATGSGYNTISIRIGRMLKETMLNSNMEADADFDEKLRKTTLYDLMLRTPDGENIMYADAGSASGNFKTAAKYQDIANWYDDRELEYIDTFGKKGIEPEWTSILFPDSRLAAMRSGWEKNALYMFTNVRGPGQHSHAADGHITLYAYDKILLTDSGRWKYDSTDPIRRYMQSTRAHNTVEINDTSQSLGSSPSNTTISNLKGRGTINQWVTNENYDFISESTTRTTGYKHQRSITFVKPYYWIVSDLMTPTNTQYFSKVNSYKQLWHMLPQSNMSVDTDSKQLRSGYSTGANIIVASADGNNVTVEEKIGYYDSGNNVEQEAPYGYFEVNTSGEATFDTILVPTVDDADAQVDVERLEIGVSTNVATALKFDIDSRGITSIGYYYLSYENENQPERSFGKYSTNGQLTFISEGISGDIENIILQNASVIKENGNVLVSYDERISDLSLERQGGTLNLTTDEESIDYSKLKIASDASLQKLIVNGTNTEFSISGGYIVFGNVIESDTVIGSGSAEIVDRTQLTNNSAGGENSGGGGAGGGGSEISEKDDKTEKEEAAQPSKPVAVFEDTIGHWAVNEIEYLYNKGIIKGKESNKFSPEDSITRAEMLTLIVRALGLNEVKYTGAFEDVLAKDWYSGVIETGLKFGLISKDKIFRPNDLVTREEMTKMITEAYKIQNELQRPAEYHMNYYDEADVSQWAKEYVCDADYLGLINGVGGGRFAPKGNATRAQSAVIIKRLLDKISK